MPAGIRLCGKGLKQKRMNKCDMQDGSVGYRLFVPIQSHANLQIQAVQACLLKTDIVDLYGEKSYFRKRKAL